MAESLEAAAGTAEPLTIAVTGADAVFTIDTPDDVKEEEDE